MTTEAPMKVSLEDLNGKVKSHIPDKADDLEYDLGNLASFDYQPVDVKSFKAHPAKFLHENARDNFQLFVNRLFDLDSYADPEGQGRLVDLPAPTTRLPREKKVPKPKEPTKWELYAAERGIQKKKSRDRMLWDEGEQDWKPRYGYKRANDDAQYPIMEAVKGRENDDPWKVAAETRKEKVDKNKKQRESNVKRAMYADGKAPSAAAPTGPAIPSTIAISSRTKADQHKRLPKSDLDKSIGVAQFATASIGKFDNAVKGEPDKKKGKKRKFDSSVGDMSNEKSKGLAILNKMSFGETMDSTKAANKHLAEAQKQYAAEAARKRLEGHGQGKKKRSAAGKGNKRGK
eukprot:GFYU01006127.1.p1 GENE.GFYU01006127.1~~GFYU01006127.1.p1  ORF type:complete len:345 (+),score=141.45 GFYU01006127.1:151-1185(+)